MNFPIVETLVNCEHLEPEDGCPENSICRVVRKAYRTGIVNGAKLLQDIALDKVEYPILPENKALRFVDEELDRIINEIKTEKKVKEYISVESSKGFEIC